MQETALVYSVVVPVYNSAQSLPELDRRLRAVCLGLGEPFELIYVDDCSRDGSWDVLQRLCDTAPQPTTVLRLAGNHGQHAATLCGIEHAAGAFIVTIDDDLECPPEEISKLVQTMQSGDLDVVYGFSLHPPHSLLRKVASLLFKSAVQRLLRTDGLASSFRLMRRSVVPGMRERIRNYVIIDAALLCTTRKVRYIKIDVPDKSDGSSRYTYVGLLLFALGLTLHYGVFPDRRRTNIFRWTLGGLALLGLGAALLCGSSPWWYRGGLVLYSFVLGGGMALSLQQYLAAKARKPRFTVGQLLRSPSWGAAEDQAPRGGENT